MTIIEAMHEAARLTSRGFEQEIEGLEILNEALSADRSDEDLIEALRGLVEALLASRYRGW